MLVLDPCLPCSFEQYPATVPHAHAAEGHQLELVILGSRRVSGLYEFQHRARTSCAKCLSRVRQLIKFGEIAVAQTALLQLEHFGADVKWSIW